MFSANALIASIAGAAIVALWARYSPKVAAWLIGIPIAIEKKYDVDIPDLLVDVYTKAVEFTVSALNDVIGNKNLMAQIVNKIRKNRGDEAAAIFEESLKKAVSAEKIENVLPPEVKAWFNEAREEIAAETIKAKVATVTPLLPEPAKPIAANITHETTLLPVIRAAVVAQKVEPPPSSKPLGQLSPEGRAAIEEMRARLGMAK